MSDLDEAIDKLHALLALLKEIELDGPSDHQLGAHMKPTASYTLYTGCKPEDAVEEVASVTIVVDTSDLVALSRWASAAALRCAAEGGNSVRLTVVGSLRNDAHDEEDE